MARSRKRANNWVVISSSTPATWTKPLISPREFRAHVSAQSKSGQYWNYRVCQVFSVSLYIPAKVAAADSEATNGLEAIEKLSLGPVAMMVLDLNMPDMLD